MSKAWLLVAGVLVGTFAKGAGSNLISDPEVESNPLSAEFRTYGPEKWGRAEATSFEEKYTWNKCIRFEVRELGTNDGGRVCIDQSLLLGGDASAPGFAVTGGEKLDFSLEVKGTAPTAIINFRWWDAEGVGRNGETNVKRFKVQKEWTVYKGQFKVPDGAVRAALAVSYWWDEQYGKVPEQPGCYVLVDKIEIVARDRKASVWPWRACVVPEKGWADLAAFIRCDNGGGASVATRAKLSADGRALRIALDCPGTAAAKPYSGKGEVRPMWFDDVVEAFIGPDDGSPGIHLAVSSGGGRWIGGGDYANWSAKVEKSGNGWRTLVTLPWKTAGFAARPADGTPIRFNLVRQRLVGAVGDAKAKRGMRDLYGYWTEDTCWSFNNLELDRPEHRGYLFLGTMRPFTDRMSSTFTELATRAAAAKLADAEPTEALRGMIALREEDRLVRLSKQKFIVAQVPICTDTSVPFMPDEINDPQPRFRVRAAVNEIASLPIALANMTDAADEYRVTLGCGWEHRDPQDEHWKAIPGLKAADGTRFGKVKLLRAVRSREGDTDPHGARLDMLVPLNVVSSVPVAPKESGLCWLEFDCRGAKPGKYSGTLLVTPLAGGTFKSFVHDFEHGGYVITDDSKRIPVELEVLPFALPEPSAMSLNGYSVAFDKYQVDFLKDYSASHICVSPWHFGVKFAADGTAERKPRQLLKPLLKMMRENVRNFGDVPGLAVCYDAYDAYRKHYGKDLARGSEAYWRGWREWLKYIREEMDAAGFPVSDYALEVLDEPNPNKYPDRAEVLKAVREAHAAVPDLRLMITSGADHYYEDLKDCVSEWVFYRAGNADEYARAREFAARPGCLSSMYDCHVSIRMDPYSYFRMLPWKAAAADAKYVSIFQTLEQITPRSFRRVPFGEMTWDTGSEVVGSVRLQCVRAGMTDVRYLRLLQSLAKGDSAAAKEAREFCAKALREIPFVFPHDRGKAEDFRDEAIRRIADLEK